MTDVSAQPKATASPDTARRLTRIGIAGLVLGLSGLVMTFATPVASLRGYGALLILLGLAQGAEAAWNRRSGALLVRVMLALIYVGCGLALMVRREGLSDSAHLVATLLLAAGAFRFVWSLAWPNAPRLWGAVAAVATIGLGLVALLGWPASAMWILGLIIALDLAIYGATTLLLGRAFHD